MLPCFPEPSVTPTDKAPASLQRFHPSTAHKPCFPPALQEKVFSFSAAKPSPGQRKVCCHCICCTDRTPTECVCVYSVVIFFPHCFLFGTKNQIILPADDGGLFSSPESVPVSMQHSLIFPLKTSQ